MKHVLNYNIYDILKFKISKDMRYGLIDIINLKFSFFKVENVDDIDITLNIGPFKPSNENCCLVDHKYYVKENYFYCKDSEGKVKWEVEIIGFEYGHTTINFRDDMHGFNSIINPDFIAQNFLLRLIEYKLSRKGYFLSHSAGISKNGEAYILAGRGGTFKTSLCMDFIRRKGFEFLGDDRVIIHKDRIFCFPMGIHVFGFMCNHLRNENCWTFFNKVRFANFLWHLKSENNRSIDVGKPCTLKKLFFMVKTNKDEIVCRDMTFEEVANKLIINNRLEDFIGLSGYINSGPFLKYVLAYSYIFPDKILNRLQEELVAVLNNILENVPIHEISIPSDYSLDLFKRMNEIIEKKE